MTLRPDILSSLEPSNNILGVFRGAAFYFPKSILLPFFFLNHLLLSYCHFLSSQTLQPVGYFIYPPFLPDPQVWSGCSLGLLHIVIWDFLYYLLLLFYYCSTAFWTSYLFFGSIQFLQGKNAIFRSGEWIPGCLWATHGGFNSSWLQISYNPPLFSLTSDSCPPLPWIMSLLAILPGWWTPMILTSTLDSGFLCLHHQFPTLYHLFIFHKVVPVSSLVALTYFLCYLKWCLFFFSLGENMSVGW